MSAGKTIVVELPSRVEVMVYPSEASPGAFVIKSSFDAKDIETGEVEPFSSTASYDSEPGLDDVLRVVSAHLAHEVAEQLGLRPHDGDNDRSDR